MPVTPLQRFWYLLHQLNWTDRQFELLKAYGVENFKFLIPEKAEELIDELQHEWNERSKRPRGAVIHYLCIMPNYNFLTDDKPYSLLNFDKKNIKEILFTIKLFKCYLGVGMLCI